MGNDFGPSQINTEIVFKRSAKRAIIASLIYISLTFCLYEVKAQGAIADCIGRIVSSMPYFSVILCRTFIRAPRFFALFSRRRHRPCVEDALKEALAPDIAAFGSCVRRDGITGRLSPEISGETLSRHTTLCLL